MQRTYDFEVIEYTDLETFKTVIRKFLEEGWELHGQLIAFPNSTDANGVHSVRYIQAVKKEIRSGGNMGFRRQ